MELVRNGGSNGDVGNLGDGGFRGCRFCGYSNIGYDLSGQSTGIRYCRVHDGKRCTVRIVEDWDVCERWKGCGMGKEIAEATDLYRVIPLSRGKVAYVDIEDYEDLIQYSWSTYGKGRGCYANCYHKGQLFYMHRYIMKPPDDLVVDHINHNGLDNRRSNLRICTPRENSWNTFKWKKGSSRFKGVR